MCIRVGSYMGGPGRFSISLQCISKPYVPRVSWLSLSRLTIIVIVATAADATTTATLAHTRLRLLSTEEEKEIAKDKGKTKEDGTKALCDFSVEEKERDLFCERALLCCIVSSCSGEEQEQKMRNRPLRVDLSLVRSLHLNILHRRFLLLLLLLLLFTSMKIQKCIRNRRKRRKS